MSLILGQEGQGIETVGDYAFSGNQQRDIVFEHPAASVEDANIDEDFVESERNMLEAYRYELDTITTAKRYFDVWAEDMFSNSYKWQRLARGEKFFISRQVNYYEANEIRVPALKNRLYGLEVQFSGISRDALDLIYSSESNSTRKTIDAIGNIYHVPEILDRYYKHITQKTNQSVQQYDRASVELEELEKAQKTLLNDRKRIKQYDKKRGENLKKFEFFVQNNIIARLPKFIQVPISSIFTLYSNQAEIDEHLSYIKKEYPRLVEEITLKKSDLTDIKKEGSVYKQIAMELMYICSYFTKYGYIPADAKFSRFNPKVESAIAPKRFNPADKIPQVRVLRKNSLENPHLLEA